MRRTYATDMLMAEMTPTICAKQLGHSVEMFLKTYSKWLAGDQNDMEMERTRNGNFSPEPPRESKTDA